MIMKRERLTEVYFDVFLVTKTELKYGIRWYLYRKTS